jgi:hypothetical protein
MPRLARWLLLLSAASVAWAADPLPTCGPIDRPHDHVALRGQTLRGLGRIPFGRFAVLAYRDGTLGPIPFQVEDARGRHPTLTDGPGVRPDNRPGEFDFDDLVVIMACDVGGRIPESGRGEVLAAARPVTWREAQVRDPLTGDLGWVYVLVTDDPPRSPRRYVGYDRPDAVRSAWYRLGMEGALPTFFSLGPAEAATGNLLDGLRVRADAVVRANLVRLERTEADVTNRLVAWGAGPVRIVRRSEHDLDIGMGIDVNVGVAHTYFYPLRITGPGKLKLPFSPVYLLKGASAYGGVDLSGLAGWRYYAPGMPQPFAIDGRPGPGERDFSRGGTWFVLAGDDLALLVVARLGPTMARAVEIELTYADDATTPRPPERQPGTVPLVGFGARDLHTLAAGRYEFAFDVLFVPGWQPGDEERLLARLAAPLEVTLSARAPRAAAPAAHP